MIELELRFDGVVVDNIYVDSIDIALDIIENNSYDFDEQNEAIKEDWIKAGGNPNPIVDICYANHLDIKCPRCGNFLYPPDVRGYDYTCYNCDENWYKCEIK